MPETITTSASRPSNATIRHEAPSEILVSIDRSLEFLKKLYRAETAQACLDPESIAYAEMRISVLETLKSEYTIWLPVITCALKEAFPDSGEAPAEPSTETSTGAETDELS